MFWILANKWYPTNVQSTCSLIVLSFPFDVLQCLMSALQSLHTYFVCPSWLLSVCVWWLLSSARHDFCLSVCDFYRLPVMTSVCLWLLSSVHEWFLSVCVRLLPSVREWLLSVCGWPLFDLYLFFVLVLMCLFALSLLHEVNVYQV